MDNTGLVTEGPLSGIAKGQPSVLRQARRVAANKGVLPKGVALRPGKNASETAQWYMDVLGRAERGAQRLHTNNAWDDPAKVGTRQLASRQLRYEAGRDPKAIQAVTLPRRYNALARMQDEQPRLTKILSSPSTPPDERARVRAQLVGMLPKEQRHLTGYPFIEQLRRTQFRRGHKLKGLKDYAASNDFRRDRIPTGRARANAEAVREFQSARNAPSAPKPPRPAPKSWARVRQEPTSRSAYPLDVSGEFRARAAQRNADRVAGASRKLDATAKGMQQQIDDLQGVPGQEMKVANLQRWLPTIQDKQKRAAAMGTDRPRSAKEPFGYTSPATQAQQARQNSNQWIRNAAIGVGGIGLVGGTGWMAYRQDPSRMANFGSSRRERKPAPNRPQGKSAVRRPTKRWWHSEQQRSRRT